MLRCRGVRTTITIDEAVYREAKALAARSARSVSELIEDAVRAALRSVEVDGADVAPLPTFGRGGTLPGVDLGDRSSLLAAMDDAGSLDALR